MKSIRSRAPKSGHSSVRRVMQSNRSTDTKPEMLLRRALHRKGLRYRVNYNPIDLYKCKADIVFIGPKLCVFVDGCFWHGCPQHFHIPKSNSSWWLEKIEDNRNRDLRKRRFLEEYGWKVIRVWEHELRNDSLENVVQRISMTVRFD